MSDPDEQQEMSDEEHEWREQMKFRATLCTECEGVGGHHTVKPARFPSYQYEPCEYCAGSGRKAETK
jgi:DnaJ-class molecular chaperone